jgi:ABC-type transport system involved in multi-copper enzyme maturation permease subunit
MSTPAPALRLDVHDTPPVPFTRLLGVEFRKSWDTRAAFWLLAAIAGLVVVIEAISLIVVVAQDESATWWDFSGAPAILTFVMLPVLGIMLVTGEWTQRSAMVTFTLESRRGRVVLAKLLVGVIAAVVTVVLSVLVGAVCNLVYAAAHGGADWSLPGRQAVGFTLVTVLAMLSGFAFAALLLNTAAAIVVLFIYRFIVPTLLALGGGAMAWFEDLAPWINFQAAQGPLGDLTMSGSDWGHLLVSALVWLVVPIAFGLRRILRAEVK